MSTATAPARTNNANGQPTPTAALAKVDEHSILTIPDLRKMLSPMVDNVRDILPVSLKGNASRYPLALVTMLYANPDLAGCTAFSLRSGMLKAASYGLELGPPLNHVYLIPRFSKHTKKMEATFQLGYPGVKILVERSPKVDYVDWNVVYEGDEFEEVCSPVREIKHKRGLKRGKIIAYYSRVFLKGGKELNKVMTVEDIEAHRKKFCECGPNGEPKGGWVKGYDGMSLKTTLLQVSKIAPKSLELPDFRKIDDEEAITAEITGPNAPQLDKPQLEGVNQPRQIETIDAAQLPPEQQQQLREVEENNAPSDDLPKIIADIERLAVQARGSWEAVRTSGLLESVKFKGTRAKELDLLQAQSIRVLLQEEVDAKPAPDAARLMVAIDTLVGIVEGREDVPGDVLEAEACREFGKRTFAELTPAELGQAHAKLKARASQ